MTQPAPVSELPLERIHAAHRQARIIVAAIASSLIMYVIVVETLRRMQPDATPVPNADILRIVFFAVAGMAIFAATVTKGILLRTAPATQEGRLARLRSTTILAAAFAETPAVFGLALFITTRRRADFYALLVVAAYMLARHFPIRDAWENYVRRGSNTR